MKYTNEIIIDAPLSKFIQMMDDPENMKHWQRGLERYEFLSGTPGEQGAQMKMYYSKPKMELLETIIKREIPNEFHATYDANGMIMTNYNYFTETEDGKTKWVSESEATTNKLLYKVMMFVAPGMFKKNSIQLMKDLKAYVEEGTSVAGQS